MFLSTLRKNFYRIASLIIDQGAESMRCLLDQFIRKKYRSSFRDYVSNHQHEIYHHFNNRICCLCSKNYRRPHKTVINAWQMEKLFDKSSQKLSCHKYTSKCDYCCSSVKSTLLLQDIDITLLRFFLVTYFEEEFWQSCFSSGMLFHDFLNTHKHDIYHLLQLNTQCCLCQAHPVYMVMMAAENDRLNKNQWETMFQVPELPCTQHRSYFPSGYILNPCSVSATVGIRHSDLDGRARTIILSKFCTLMMHIEVLVNARNTIYAHALKGVLIDEEFIHYWNEIESSIIYISGVTCTVEGRKNEIFELREKSLEESMCLEFQCLIIKSMQRHEQILQNTVEGFKGIIDVKIQQLELQITALTSKILDVVRTDFSTQLNEYSDATQNVIDNTTREIDIHDEDTTYVKTSAVTAAMKLLEEKNLLILKGRAGSGKTSTALEIASKFRAKEYIIMKLEQTLAKYFKTYFKSKNKQLIIFEDLFGKTDVKYNTDIHSCLLDVLKPHVSKGVSKFIITVRGYTCEDDIDMAIYHHVLLEARIIDLNESFSLNNFEKESILSMHAMHNQLEISFENMQNIIQTNSYLGFPEACFLYSSIPKFFDMGNTFFTSPTEVLQNEISDLKMSGYTNIDSALQYCVLVCLMMEFASNHSFSETIHKVFYESNVSSNNVKNISISAIEYLYQSLYTNGIRVTNIVLHKICKQLSNKYIKSDMNSTTYEFQHQTVFEAVLSSYWDPKTIDDIIKYFNADILAEHFRPFDSTIKGNKKYFIFPKEKCTGLAEKLFETFVAKSKITKILNLEEDQLGKSIISWQNQITKRIKNEWTKTVIFLTWCRHFQI